MSGTWTTTPGRRGARLGPRRRQQQPTCRRKRLTGTPCDGALHCPAPLEPPAPWPILLGDACCYRVFVHSVDAGDARQGVLEADLLTLIAAWPTCPTPPRPRSWPSWPSLNVKPRTIQQRAPTHPVHDPTSLPVSTESLDVQHSEKAATEVPEETESWPEALPTEVQRLRPRGNHLAVGPPPSLAFTVPGVRRSTELVSAGVGKFVVEQAYLIHRRRTCTHGRTSRTGGYRRA